MSDKIRYVESYLPGSIRCVDGTLVVFISPKDEDDGGTQVGRRPRTPKPTLPAVEIEAPV